MGEEVEVRILGNKHLFETDVNKKEAIRIAMFVDEEAKELREKNPNISENKIAIMTALNIADKLFKIGSHIEKLRKYVED